jgi:hypothetical protein
MTHDYKKALDEMVDGRAGVGDWYLKNMNAIRHALELAIALQPKPISEVSFDNRNIILLNSEFGFLKQCYKLSDWPYGVEPTHFYDISALPKPEGD